jgi:uncharacterized protein YebE (UPF0316 family)
MIVSMIILFIVGYCEELVAMLFYKTGQKNFDGICASLCLIRSILWIFVITTLIKHTEHSIFIALSYVIGCSLGCYFSLKIEPMLEKHFKVLKKNGRRFKRWFLKHKRK